MKLNRWLYMIGFLIFGGLAAGIVLSGFSLWVIPLLGGVFAIYLAGIFASRIISRKPKSASMVEVSDDIRSAAGVYMRRQVKTILLAIPVMAAVVYAFMGWREALAFVIGVVTSITSGYLGMSISVRTNIQTADLAEESFAKSFRVAVLGGGVMGMLITGLSLVVLTILFVIFKDPNVLIGFGVGRLAGCAFWPDWRRYFHQIR